MRINYTDEEDYPGQFNLWQANCRRSMRGKAGQQALRELETALLAMPEQELYHGVFVQPSGEACALGALMVERKVAEGLSRDEAIAVCADVDPDESQEAGERLGIPPMVAWSIVAQNDVALDFHYVTAEGPVQNPWNYGAGYLIRVPYTPAERHALMLTWVRAKLVTGDDVPTNGDVQEATK